MDQDGFNIAIAVLALLILASGLWRGDFEVQFLRADSRANPIRYWIFAAVLVLVIGEASIRAWRGCINC
jgi:hypothetical protein